MISVFINPPDDSYQKQEGTPYVLDISPCCGKRECVEQAWAQVKASTIGEIETRSATDADISDELSDVVDAIREYCAQKGLVVFPGWLSGRQVHKVDWEASQEDEWQAFLDAAATLGVRMIYLSAYRFTLSRLEEAKTGWVGAGDPESSLQEFRARVGQTAWFEIGFFLGSIYHSYTRAATWYDSFGDLTREEGGITSSQQVGAQPDVIDKWAEALAKHQRFPECTDWSQRQALLMSIAGDEFARLRPGQGIKKIIERARQYYFITVKPQNDEKLRIEARALREQGMTLTEVAGRLGVSRDKIRRLK